MEHPAHGHRLVVAVGLEVEGREAEGRPQHDDPGQGDELRRRADAPACLLEPDGYGLTPPGGGGGGSGGSKA